MLVTLRPARAGLILAIEDDGPGFPPEVLDWLGEPFLSTRREEGGLGLGIFIATTLLSRTVPRSISTTPIRRPCDHQMAGK